jgi:hypothetical protein
MACHSMMVAVDEPPRRSRRRLRRVMIGVAAVIVVLVGAAALWYVFGREEAKEVSAEDALAKFREKEGASADTAGRPTAGVYTATATGSESIGLPGFDEGFGPNAPVVVTHGDGGCFTYRADFNSHHWRSWTYCPTATATFALTGLESWTARKAPGLDIESLTTYTCTRPLDFLWRGAADGDTRHGSCTGTTDGDDAVTADAATIEVLDVGHLMVARTRVEVVHVRTTDTFSRAQTGTEVDEWWLDATSGLPLKVLIDAELKGGPSDYSEKGSLVLSSLEARR